MMPRTTHLQSALVALGFCCTLSANDLCSALTTFTTGSGELRGGDGYTAVLAMGTVVVDSSYRTVAPPNPWEYHLQLSLLSMAPLDTALYGTDSYVFHAFLPDSLLNYDTSLATRQLVYSGGHGPYPVAAGDTLRNAFVLQETWPDSQTAWTVAHGECYFRSGSVLGLELVDALELFGQYLDSTGAYEGYEPPPWGAKLGPVMEFAWGDEGWRLRAYADSGCWYLEHLTGDGDCPAGCTIRRVWLYRVCLGGQVELIGQQFCTTYPCQWLGVTHAARSSPTVSASAGAARFDLRGRLLRVPVGREHTGVFLRLNSALSSVRLCGKAISTGGRAALTIRSESTGEVP
jgi:hypothetical protein